MVFIFLFILGTSIGSFINAFVYRLQNNLPIVNERSICPHCKHILAWHDLIPLLSFLLLRGRCRYCREHISWQYPLVECLMGFVMVLPVIKIFNFQFSITNEFSIFNFQFLRYFVFAIILMIIFAYDLRYMLIPDKISIPAIFITFLIQVFIIHYSLFIILLAAFIGFTFFFLQFIISKGKWIGGGDLRLGFLMGLMVGFPNIIVAILLAYVGGSIITLPLVVLGRKGMKSAVPFGVFLTISTIITYLWGDFLIATYMAIIL